MTSKKILEKVEKNQATITTDEDLGSFGYHKNGKNCYGKTIWANVETIKKYRAQTKKWLDENREWKKEYDKRWNSEHPERRRELARNFREEHLEEGNERRKEYYHNHTEERGEYGRIYYQNNIEKKRKHNKVYNRSPEGRETQQRSKTKRQRGLGFEPLNEWFSGSEAHHVNKNVIIYIPEEIHRSISHNIWNGKGMEEINKAAFEWLEHELIRDAFDALESQPHNKIFGKPRKEIIWEVKV